METIIAFALACVAAACAVLASHIYLRNEHSKLDLRLSASCYSTRDTLVTSLTSLSGRLDVFVSQLAACESSLKAASGTHLAGEVAALAADVDTLARSMRKQLGKVWAELHHDGTLARNNAAQRDVETPEDVRARLRLQHGLPKMGGVVNGSEE